jgi:hypothetical protein
MRLLNKINHLNELVITYSILYILIKLIKPIA